MLLFPMSPRFWSIFLLLLASQSAAAKLDNNDYDNICENLPEEGLEVRNSASPDEVVSSEMSATETFTCLLYPVNLLNCSWSFETLPDNTQLSVSISVCNDETLPILNISNLSVENVGSISSVVQQHNIYLLIQFNKSSDTEWTTYRNIYEMESYEILPPPSNISAKMEARDLVVTWNTPYNRDTYHCFEYQLDLGYQGILINISDELSYKALNAEPNYVYRVRLRTRSTYSCTGLHQWSEWSPVIVVEQVVNKLNSFCIISIALGIPMILLSVLLLVRHQRLSEVLFPPIPRPPPRYIYFLEKNDTFSVFQPAQSSKAEEVITEVDDTVEENFSVKL